jgi:hypothetical protein
VTDGAKDAHLITYIRFVDEKIKEDLLLCKEIRHVKLKNFSILIINI